jgi:hypothetical protein
MLRIILIVGLVLIAGFIGYAIGRRRGSRLAEWNTERIYLHG